MGKCLSHASNSFIVSEPLAEWNYPYYSGGGSLFDRWMQHSGEELLVQHKDEVGHALRLSFRPGDFLRYFRHGTSIREKLRVMKRYLEHRPRRGLTPIIKDPMAFFDAQYLAKIFEMNVVVVARHPMAFFLSCKRMGWYPGLFNKILSQPKLVESFCSDSFLEDCRKCDDGDNLRKTFLFWRLIHEVASSFESNPSFTMVRHEDLCLSSSEQYMELYEFLGLRWDKDVESSILSSVNGDEDLTMTSKVIHPTDRNSRDIAYKWKKHADHETLSVCQDMCGEVAHALYPEKDWWTLE